MPLYHNSNRFDNDPLTDVGMSHYMSQHGNLLPGRFHHLVHRRLGHGGAVHRQVDNLGGKLPAGLLLNASSHGGTDAPAIVEIKIEIITGKCTTCGEGFKGNSCDRQTQQNPPLDVIDGNTRLTHAGQSSSQPDRQRKIPIGKNIALCMEATRHQLRVMQWTNSFD